MNTKHLKAKILDLAIRGKLVPQDPSEGNATDLLEKIRAEGAELVKQKKIKEDKNFSLIIKTDDGRHYEQFAEGTLKDIEDEIPFEIPDNWCWCRLGLILSIKSGDLIRVTENQVGEYPIYGGNGVNGYYSKYNVEANTIIIGRVGFYCGSIHITKERAWVTDNAFITSFDSNLIQGNFLFYLLQRLDLKNKSNSTAQPVVSGRGIYPIFVPLPPLAEQERIVSAIEKAFEQIDIIEKNKLNLKNYIKQTKSKVLDLAIHGRLVEQNPKEGNAFELLEKIRNEKAEQTKQKKIKADKSASFIIKAEDGRHYEQFADGTLKDIEGNIPFAIPDSWCWCRLTTLCDYGKCKNADPTEILPESWILDLEDIEKDTGKINKYITFAERNSLSTKHIFSKGTLLYSKLRPYLNKVVIAPKDGFCTSEILPLDFSGAYINIFAQRLLMSPYFLSTVNILTYGVKMPRLGTNEANQILLPLPPLAEQQRIVAKIEQIFAQLDTLEKSLGE